MDKDERARFGALVLRARQESQLSQEEFAARCGVTAKTLAGVESGGKAWASTISNIRAYLKEVAETEAADSTSAASDMVGSWLRKFPESKRGDAMLTLAGWLNDHQYVK